MTDIENFNKNQLELLKKLKSVGSDLWGAIADQGVPDAGDSAAPAAADKKPRSSGLDALWKTADETIDWTDALAHSTPKDGLTAQRLWNFYHKQAEKVLSGDLDAYTEVLKAANPLGELTEYADSITMRAPFADRLESRFVCREEQMGKNRKRYLAAMGLRIARDLLACLPVSEVEIKGIYEGKPAFEVTFNRHQLMHRNFAFLDPVALCEECGAAFH